MHSMHLIYNDSTWTPSSILTKLEFVSFIAETILEYIGSYFPNEMTPEMMQNASRLQQANLSLVHADGPRAESLPVFIKCNKLFQIEINPKLN